MNTPNLFKIYYDTDIVQAYYEEPTDKFRYFTKPDGHEYFYARVTFKENLENALFRLKWILDNRELIENKQIEWATSPSKNTDDEIFNKTCIKMPNDPYDSLSTISHFDITEGVCDNVNLYVVRKKLRRLMSLEFINKLEAERACCIEYDESYPIPGGQPQYNKDIDKREMWLNSDRWAYVEFCHEHITKLIANLES